MLGHNPSVILFLIPFGVLSLVCVFAREQIKWRAVTSRILSPLEWQTSLLLCCMGRRVVWQWWGAGATGPRALSCVCLSTLAVQNFLHLYSRHRQADRWQPAWQGHVTRWTRQPANQNVKLGRLTGNVLFFPSKRVQIKKFIFSCASNLCLQQLHHSFAVILIAI